MENLNKGYKISFSFFCKATRGGVKNDIRIENISNNPIQYFIEEKEFEC